MKDETRIIRAGADPRPLVRTVNPPIQRASTVLLPDAASLYDPGQVSYGRDALSARQALCDAISEMEGAAGAKLFPSGLAAMTGTLLALLGAGDEVLVCQHVYRPTRRFCDRVLKRFGVGVAYYDQTLPASDLMSLVTAKTRAIVLESPGSLSFEMQDVAAIAAAARDRGVLTVMDNTWGAGLLFKPIAHGVDVSCQALTKYVGGHSDVFMGSAAARDPQVFRRLEAAMHEVGWSVSPEDAYLMLRSLRTLPTRLKRHGESGMRVAQWLRKQSEVIEVLHPALPGARGHDTWARDYAGGACGLFGFVLRPAPEKAVEAFLDALTLFGLGFSWGGHESLAIHCDPQRKTGSVLGDYGGPLMRLHVGLEDPDDLIGDLRNGLDAYNSARTPPNVQGEP
jgi:cystathionine beta-lyase